MPNPFVYGNPVLPDQFIKRRQELRSIVSRIVGYGQSTAIVGEPRIGKTSLLTYLAAPEKRTELYDTKGEHLLFSYLDAQMSGRQFNQAQFWEHVLSTLYERVIVPNPVSPLAEAYQTCQSNNFGAFVLERLLAQVRLKNWRLVLMLDEFDVLLYSSLNCAEFFGSLRSLASRSRGALALIIASRRSLASLNKDTQEFSRTGSPYFNFFDEITLKPFSNRAISELLDWAKERFTPKDRRFIVEMAGGHPYLLQVAASVLWETDTKGIDDPVRRWTQVGQSLYDKASQTLENTWRLWPAPKRMAFMATALDQITLKHREFDKDRLLYDMRDFGPELRSLSRQGFVTEDVNALGGWRVRPRAFLWWIADELVRTVRDDESFEEWLQAQEWEGLLKPAAKEKLDKVAHSTADLLKDGVTKFIETTAKGLAEAWVK